MKTEIKALVVFVVLLLSVGPLVYFFGGADADNNNAGEPTAPELPYTVEGIRTAGEIIQLDDYIIYNGITPYNNPAYVNKTLFETIGLKEDVKITMKLNSGAEGGYQYHIKAKIPGGMTGQELGLRMAHDLRPFFLSSEVWPVRMGKIKLPEKMEMTFSDNVTKKIGLNKTLDLVALYWQLPKAKIAIYCPKMKFDKETKEYLGSEDICYDMTSTEDLGLAKTIIDELTEKMVRRDLKVDLVKGIYYETDEKLGVDVSKIFKVLSEWYTEKTLSVRNENGKFKIDAAYIDEEKSTEFIRDELEKLGLKITDGFKEGYVSLPYEFTVGEDTYHMLNAQLQRAKLKIDSVQGETATFNVYIKGKYEQLLSVRVEEA